MASLSDDGINDYYDQHLAEVTNEIGSKVNKFSQLHGGDRKRTIYFARGKQSESRPIKLPSIDLDYIAPKAAAEALDPIIKASGLTLRRDTSKANPGSGNNYFVIVAEGRTTEALDKFKEGLEKLSEMLTIENREMKRKQSRGSQASKG